MDLLDLYFLRLLERGQPKQRAMRTVETLRAGLISGAVHTRCQRRRCRNLLFPRLKRRWCSKECKEATRLSKRKDGRRGRVGRYTAAEAQRGAKARLEAFTALLGALPSHCQASPCQNLLHHVHRAGHRAVCCSRRCAYRMASWRRRERLASAQRRRLRTYTWRPR